MGQWRCLQLVPQRFSERVGVLHRACWCGRRIGWFFPPISSGSHQAAHRSVFGRTLSVWGCILCCCSESCFNLGFAGGRVGKRKRSSEQAYFSYRNFAGSPRARLPSETDVRRSEPQSPRIENDVNVRTFRTGGEWCGYCTRPSLRPSYHVFSNMRENRMDIADLYDLACSTLSASIAPISTPSRHQRHQTKHRGAPTHLTLPTTGLLGFRRTSRLRRHRPESAASDPAAGTKVSLPG